MGDNKVEIPYGNSRAIEATLTDPDGAALDLTGATIVLSVREDHTADAYTEVHNCDTAFDPVDATVTVTLSDDKQEGEKSNKLAVADGAVVGILATDVITSLDLSGHSSIHLWVKSSVNLDAGDLQLLLDNTALCASPLKTLNLPAITANTWTKVVLMFDDTYHRADEELAGIISVGIKMAVDKGAFDLYIDEIRAGNYFIEKFPGDGGASPTLGIAYFNLTPELTELLAAGTFDFDIDVYWAGTGVRYSPVIDDFEVLDHASVKD